MAALLVATVAFNFIYTLAIERDTQKVVSDIETIRPLLEKRFELMSNDLDLLVDSLPVQGIVRGAHAANLDSTDSSGLDELRNRLAAIFKSTLKTRGDYSQLRLIGLDDSGREIVRVERRDNKLEVVAPEPLQRKGNEIYIREAIGLSRGQTLFSKISPIREWGKIVPGSPPTIRVSKPVFTEGGGLSGLLVINAAIDQIVSDVLLGAPTAWDLTLVDQAGNYFRFDAHDAHTTFHWADSDPEAAPFIRSIVQANPSQFLETTNDGLAMTTFIADINLASGFAGNTMRLAASANHDALFAEADGLVRLILILLLAVVAIAASVGLLCGRHIVKPISRLTEAVDAYQTTGSLEHLPTTAPGEIGQLAQSFENFIRSVEVAWDAEQNSHLRLKHIVDNSVDGIMTINQTGEILTVNPACVNMFGYHGDAVVGENISKLLGGAPFTASTHVEDNSDGDKFVLAQSTSERSFWAAVGRTQEYRASRADDRQFPIELSLSRVELADDVLFSVVVRDITQRATANELLNDTVSRVTEINEELTHSNSQLDQSNKDIRALTHIVSHDLRAPLINILAFSGELQNEVNDLLERAQAAGQCDLEDQRFATEKAIPKVLGFITASAKKMDERLNFILKLSRLGTYEFDPRQLDLSHLVRDTLRQLVRPEDLSAITIEVDVPPIWVDHDAMSVLVTNLMSNAVKYRQQDRPLKVTVCANLQDLDSVLHLTVQDNGRGIAAASLTDIFTLFRRVGVQDTSGEGIGLAYCQTLVTRLQGSIVCESEEGEGSLFTVKIPIQVEQNERGAA